MNQMPLKWGLLSTARINRALIPPLRVSKRNMLLAVASRSEEPAQAYAGEWKIPRAYGNYEALLADPEIDVIYNSLPNHLHAEWTVKAMRAGKHILCEKPMTLSLAELDEVAATARETGMVAAEAFMYRHHPQTLRVKELVDGGEVGDLQLVRGSFSYTMTREENFRAASAGLGGGSIWDVGCYPISYARFLTGKEPTEVFGWQVTGRGGIDETFVGQMRFPGNIHAQFDSGFKSPHRVQIEVVGSRGRLQIVNPYKPGLGEQISFTRRDKTEMIQIPGQELYIGEVEDMAEAILEGKPARISLEDSRGNLAAILALIQSAQTGRVERLEE